MKCLASKLGSAAAMASSPAATLDPLSAMSFQRSAGGGAASTGRADCRLGRARRQGHDLVGRRAAHRVARRIGIVGRPLPPGPLAQNAAKPQENEYGERQEDDGVDVEHVSILSASRMTDDTIPKAVQKSRTRREAPESPLYVGTRGEPSSGRWPIARADAKV